MKCRWALCIVALAGAASLFGARADIVEGNPGSLVKVTIYEDLQCSDCLAFRTLLDEKILPRYGSRVAFLHRDFPLPKHDWARAAAVAGRWVYEQSRSLGIIYRREIMAEQSHLSVATLNAWLTDFARRNHLDERAMVASLTDPRLVALVDQDYQGAVGRGISHTPTVYIGNQSFVETIIYEDIARALDVELGH